MGRPTQRPRGTFGQRLFTLREIAGLTQHDLAQRIDVDQSNIAFWERWDKPPRGEVLPGLAKALRVSVDELLGVSGEKTKRPVAKGKLQQLFEATSQLPRRQQQKIAEVVEALLDRQANGHAKAA